LTWNHFLRTFFLIGFVEEIPYRGFILQNGKNGLILGLPIRHQPVAAVVTYEAFR